MGEDSLKAGHVSGTGRYCTELLLTARRHAADVFKAVEFELLQIPRTSCLLQAQVFG